MNFREIIERKSKIFKNEERLQVDYIPSQLPHRKEQLNMLAYMFSSVIKKPGSLSLKVILTGKIGTGKTVVTKRFGLDAVKLANNRGFKFSYVHVNCHKDRSLFLVMGRVVRELRLLSQIRGFSSQELIEFLLNALETKDEYLILTLDEVDYLIKLSGEEAIYDLSRFSDEKLNKKQRINLILIMRELSTLYLLDESTRSSLQHNIIKFNPYTSRELIDILWERIRVEKAIYEDAVSQETIDAIGELVGIDKGGKGDARLALEILWRAGKYAEKYNDDKIRLEYIRKAYSDSLLTFYFDVRNLRLHEAILLLSIARLLKSIESMYIKFSDVEKEYALLCEELNEKPRKHTAVWGIIQKLKNMGIIETKLSGKGYRGKTTLIGISATPLANLERELIEHIKNSKKISSNI